MGVVEVGFDEPESSLLCPYLFREIVMAAVQDNTGCNISLGPGLVKVMLYKRLFDNCLVVVFEIPLDGEIRLFAYDLPDYDVWSHFDEIVQWLIVAIRLMRGGIENGHRV